VSADLGPDENTSLIEPSIFKNHAQRQPLLTVDLIVKRAKTEPIAMDAPVLDGIRWLINSLLYYLHLKITNAGWRAFGQEPLEIRAGYLLDTELSNNFSPKKELLSKIRDAITNSEFGFAPATTSLIAARVPGPWVTKPYRDQFAPTISFLTNPFIRRKSNSSSAKYFVPSFVKCTSS
jgi:hypothetical protein